MRSFLSGVLLGAAISGLVFSFAARDAYDLASTDGPAASEIATTRVEPDAGRANDTSRASRVVARRVALGAEVRPAPEAPAPLPRAKCEATLLAELDQLAQAGLLAASFEGDDEELLDFLISSWIAGRRPERAWALMHRLRNGHNVRIFGVAIGDALAEKQQRALAIEAYLMGISEDPEGAVAGLLELDPARALEALQGPSIKPAHAAEVRAGQIVLLAKLGRTRELLEIVDAQLARGQFHFDSWESVIEASPIEAEKRLRAQIASTVTDHRRSLQLRLVDALLKQERRDEAAAVLERGLARAFDTTWAAELASVSRPAALEILEERARSHPRDNDTLTLYGEQLLDLRRKAEAISILERSMRIRLTGRVARAFLRAAPQRAVRQLLPRARQSKDDELLGEIADTLWKSGDRARALGLYEEALRHDPDDSEWSAKLAAARAGRDALKVDW